MYQIHKELGDSGVLASVEIIGLAIALERPVSILLLAPGGSDILRDCYRVEK